jgi:hypothetical protein
MHLISSLKDTRDSLELIIRSYHYPDSVFLQMMAEKELQSRLSDLFAEVELVLIAAAGVNDSSNDNRRLAPSVTCGAVGSIVDGNRFYLSLPPLVY